MQRRSAPLVVSILTGLTVLTGLAGVAGLFGAATPLAAPDVAAPDAGASRRAEAAAALLDSLSTEQRDDATWPFDDAERSDIRYAPIWLDGVRDDALPAAAREPAEALLAATLSPAGRERVELIRELERAVLALERERWWGFATRWLRDPGRYLWAFFGEPGPGPWAFRLEGHHLSLHLTEVPGRTPASTPLFLGARPRVVPDGLPAAGSAALGEEERLARALYASLDPEQRARGRPPRRAPPRPARAPRRLPGSLRRPVGGADRGGSALGDRRRPGAPALRPRGGGRSAPRLLHPRLGAGPARRDRQHHRRRPRPRRLAPPRRRLRPRPPGPPPPKAPRHRPGPLSPLARIPPPRVAGCGDRSLGAQGFVVGVVGFEPTTRIPPTIPERSRNQLESLAFSRTGAHQDPAAEP